MIIEIKPNGAFKLYFTTKSNDRKEKHNLLHQKFFVNTID